MKKILTIILIIIILVAVGLLVGFLLIKNTPQGESVTKSVANFLPFGKAPDNSTSTDQTNSSGTDTSSSSDTTATDNSQTAPVPRLRRVSTAPVSGAVSFDIKSGTTTKTVVRYIEKATGNMYEASVDSIGVKRLSNTTIPKIYDALWTDQSSAILQYLKDDNDTVQTVFAKLSAQKSTTTDSTTPGVLVVTFLPINIPDIQVSPSKTKIFYLTAGGDGVAGLVANSDGSKPAQIFTSPFTEWQISWPNESTIALTTKPSANVPGYLYFLNSKSGAFTRVMGGINGLTTLASPDLSRILYSESTGGLLSTISTNLFVVKNSSTSSFGLKTLPEKCIWSEKETAIYCAIPQTMPGGDYPDAWYQGVVSFADDIWKINTTTGAVVKIASLSDLARENLDAIKLSLTNKEDYLIFTNKTDSTLWSLRIGS